MKIAHKLYWMAHSNSFLLQYFKYVEVFLNLEMIIFYFHNKKSKVILTLYISFVYGQQLNAFLTSEHFLLMC